MQKFKSYKFLISFNTKQRFVGQNTRCAGQLSRGCLRKGARQDRGMNGAFQDGMGQKTSNCGTTYSSLYLSMSFSVSHSLLALYEYLLNTNFHGGHGSEQQ